MTEGLVRRVLTEKRSLVAPLAIAVVVNIAAYVLVVYPLGARVRGAEARSQRAIEAAQAAERDFAAAKATQSIKLRQCVRPELWWRTRPPPLERPLHNS